MYQRKDKLKNYKVIIYTKIRKLKEPHSGSNPTNLVYHWKHHLWNKNKKWKDLKLEIKKLKIHEEFMRTLGKNRVDQEDQWDHCNKSLERIKRILSQKNIWCEDLMGSQLPLQIMHWSIKSNYSHLSLNIRVS